MRAARILLGEARLALEGQHPQPALRHPRHARLGAQRIGQTQQEHLPLLTFAQGARPFLDPHLQFALAEPCGLQGTGHLIARRGEPAQPFEQPTILPVELAIRIMRDDPQGADRLALVEEGHQQQFVNRRLDITVPEEPCRMLEQLHRPPRDHDAAGAGVDRHDPTAKPCPCPGQRDPLELVAAIFGVQQADPGGPGNPLRDDMVAQRLQ